MEEQLHKTVKQLTRLQINKLIKELEHLHDEDYRDLIKFLTSFI